MIKESGEQFEWRPSPAGKLQRFAAGSDQSPYDRSLAGEFSRLLLLLVAIPVLIWFTYAILELKHGFVSGVASVILLASLLNNRGSQLIRIGVLGLLTVNVLSSVVNISYAISDPNYAASDVPNRVLFTCLVIALLFELSGWFWDCSNTVQYKILAWGLFAIPALVFIIAIPLFDLLWVSFEGDQRKLALRDPDWNFWNEAVFRACQFLIFSLFTYVGACIGSFLNVVAYSVPRGESIGLRDSKCQICNSKISRLDNLPIFSYINLGAQCRNCHTHIPARYLIVELVVATIFGSLFLYELITGCDNVPAMRITHEGILWIILYPKWPAISIYIFHTLFMSTVLVLAIIELDRQPTKLLFSSLVVAAFFVAPLLYWPIQPVSVTQHLSMTIELTPWALQLLKMVVGGVAGAVVAIGIGLSVAACRGNSFRLAMVLLGIVLGWQALFQVSVLFLLALAAIHLLPKLRTIASLPTSVLLAIIMVHHPFWKIISAWWD